MPKLDSRVVCSIVTAWGIKMKRALLVASVASTVEIGRASCRERV